MSHSHRRSVLKRLAGALLACGAGAALVNPVAPPTSAQAAQDYSVPDGFATGGSGRFVDSIQWLRWATYEQFEASRQGPKNKPNLPVLDYGQTRDFVNTRDLGNAGTLQTVCRLSNLRLKDHHPLSTDAQARGPLVATIPGTWIGDVLDNMYNVGGPGEWTGSCPSTSRAWSSLTPRRPPRVPRTVRSGTGPSLTSGCRPPPTNL